MRMVNLMNIYTKQVLMLYFRYLFIFLLLAQYIYANSSLAVIVSKDSNIKTISKKNISNIFLAKTKKLPNGQKAITVELNENKYKEQFYKQIAGKSLKRLKKYWAALIFTGKGQPPKKMKNAFEIIEFVKTHTNAIAYIPTVDALSADIQIIMELK